MQWSLDVRRDERRTVLGAFFALLGTTAAHNMVETARDALFLARVPVVRLVWVYLAIAAVTAVVARIRRGLRTKEERERITPGLLVGAGVTLAFWRAAGLKTVWVPYLLYLWPGLYGTWVVAALWGMIGGALTLSQAKRLFGIIGAGGVLGALVGSLLARIVTSAFPPEQLLPMAAAVLLLTGLGPGRVLDRTLVPSTPRVGDGDRAPSTLGSAVRSLAENAYGKRILALVFLATMSFTTTDFLFKSSVAAHIRAAELGSFLATVSLALNGLALVVQLVLVRVVLRVFGVHRALSVLPLFLAIAAAAVMAAPLLAAAVVVRAVDSAFRHSLHKTTSELLFVPLSREEKGLLQPVVDLLGMRGGQVAASVTLLPIFAFGGERALGGALLVLASAWLALAFSFRRPYLDVFRKALREGRLEESEAPALDLAALEILLAALNSDRDSEVLGALDLLAAQDRGKVVPSLILYHPSKPVVLRALALLTAARRTDFVPIADRLVTDHTEAEVRAAALRARWQVAADEEFMRTCLVTREGFAEVRATALVALVARGLLTDDQAQPEIVALAAGERGVRLALAQAISLEPAPAYEGALLSLARDDSPEVRAAAASAMGRAASARFIPVLIELLGGRYEAAAARDALCDIGDAAFEYLDRAVGDRDLRIELRGGAARALGQLGGPRSARALVSHLVALVGEPTLQSRIARALSALRVRQPEIVLDRAALSQVCEGALRGAFGSLSSRLALEEAVSLEDPRRTPVFELLVTMLRDDESDSIGRICLLLGLVYPQERFAHIHRGLRARSPKTRASSRELIENVVQPPLRAGLLALIDDGPDTQRLARAGTWARKSPAGLSEVVRDLLSRGGDLQSLAACYAAEVQLFDLDEAEVFRPSAAPSALRAGLAARVRESLSARGVRRAS